LSEARAAAGGDGARPLLELRGVERRYRLGQNEVRALDALDLAIERGEYLALVGASGSGKSTLLYILGCLDRPTAGTYRIDGQAVESLDDDTLADVRNRRFGFVFQSFHLLPRQSAVDNVALPLAYRGVPVAERERRARAALERMGLGDRLTHFPNQLSGGQCQRVAIARALVGDPDVILADEPTGNLDSAAAAELMLLIDGLHRSGTTVIVVTHDAAVARHCPRRLRLQDGRIVATEGGAEPAALEA
jgi:putative ABC transport system ATP-binding protein